MPVNATMPPPGACDGSVQPDPQRHPMGCPRGSTVFQGRQVAVFEDDLEHDAENGSTGLFIVRPRNSNWSPMPGCVENIDRRSNPQAEATLIQRTI